MRILIAASLFPPDIGGPATYVPRLAEGLLGRGHAVRVVAWSDGAEGEDARHPYPVLRVRRDAPKPLRFLRTVAAIVDHGRRADLVYANGLGLEAALANLILQRPMVQKVVGDLVWERATSWGWVSDGFEDFQRRRHGPRLEALKALRSWWTRRAARVIVPSRYLGRWVESWGVHPRRVRVIYNSVERANGVRAASAPLTAPLKAVTVGRLVKWKHVDQILEALADLKGVGLVVVGDGPERARLEALAARPELAGRVHFAGSRGREETSALMAACDLFVLNSSYEGLPHVVLEAMSLGLPVIATDAGGTGEVVSPGENGRLIPPLRPDLLRAAIADLAGRPEERRRLGAGARETAARFAFGRMLDESAELFEGAARP